jgi:predicted nucleic-acid-binding protein
MIGLDTNVIVRYIIQDDPKQSRLATSFIEQLTAASPGFVSLVTVTELVWVLEAAYSLTRNQIVDVLVNMMNIEVFKVERVAVVAAAVRSFKAGRADFADCLIERSSSNAGSEGTMTFDRAAAKSAGMVLIE